MQLHDYYALCEVRRLDLEAHARQIKQRADWLHFQAAQRPARRDALARWAGNRLIGAGEWLRGRAGQSGVRQEGCAVARYRTSLPGR